MAMGMGAILAKASMEMQREKQTGCPSCPLCGQPMESNGVVWSCVHGKADHQTWLWSRSKAAFKASEAGEIVFWLDLETAPKYRIDNWDPNMQGMIVAIALKPEGKSLDDAWMFETRRGPGGATTFVATKPASGIDGFFPSQDDWQLMKWTTQEGGENE